MAILSFPTGMITSLRKRCELTSIESINYKNCDKSFLLGLDKSAYWLFIIGLFPGDQTLELEAHYKVIGILYIGLFLERAAISWLKNRWGCDYFYFQKFIEIEYRNKALNEKWKNSHIKYRPDHYAYHNFYKSYNW
jgi:hypothetical protein